MDSKNKREILSDLNNSYSLLLEKRINLVDFSNYIRKGSFLFNKIVLFDYLEEATRNLDLALNVIYSEIKIWNLIISEEDNKEAKK